MSRYSAQVSRRCQRQRSRRLRRWDPLGLRICLPALTNNLVNLVKTTTLAYAIGVPELLYAAAQIWAEVMNVREMMVVLMLTYLVLIAVLVWVMERWERSLEIPGFAE